MIRKFTKQKDDAFTKKTGKRNSRQETDKMRIQQQNKMKEKPCMKMKDENGKKYFTC